MSVYYVDPLEGDDDDNGESEETAFQTLIPVSRDGDVVLEAGDEVLVKDNAVIQPDDKLDFSFLEGTEENRIFIHGFEQSKPIIDFNEMPGNGIDMYGTQYLKFADFEVRNVGDNAIRCNGANKQDARGCVFENLELHDYGFDNEWAGNGLIFYGNSYDHLVSNCVAYNGHTQNHSDGFYVGGTMDNLSGGHTFRDCVAYRNADDGFDLYRADPDNPVKLKGCIAHHNGKDGRGNTGDGNGFKMSGGWKTGGHEAQFCISYSNTVRGFDANGGSEEIKLLHCTAWKNGKYGFQFTGDTDGDHIARNCLSWGSGKEEVANKWNVTEGSNSWDLGIGDPMFISVNEGDKGFLMLSPNSPAIDAGEDVGLRFNGEAPDLGANEFDGSGGGDGGDDDDSNGGAGNGDGGNGSGNGSGNGDTTKRFEIMLSGEAVEV